MVTYNLTHKGEGAVFIFLAFLRYGLKYHIPGGERGEKSLPSFRDTIKQYPESSNNASGQSGKALMVEKRVTLFDPALA